MRKLSFESKSSTSNKTIGNFLRDKQQLPVTSSNNDGINTNAVVDDRVSYSNGEPTTTSNSERYKVREKLFCSNVNSGTRISTVIENNENRGASSCKSDTKKYSISRKIPRPVNNSNTSLNFVTNSNNVSHKQSDFCMINNDLPPVPYNDSFNNSVTPSQSVKGGERPVRLSRKPSLRTLLFPFRDDTKKVKRSLTNSLDQVPETNNIPIQYPTNSFSEGWKSQQSRSESKSNVSEHQIGRDHKTRRKLGVSGLFNFNLGVHRDGPSTYKSFADSGDSMDNNSLSSANDTLSRSSTVGANRKKCANNSHTENKTRSGKLYNVFRSSVNNSSKENILQKASNKWSDWHNNNTSDRSRNVTSYSKLNNEINNEKSFYPVCSTSDTNGDSLRQQTVNRTASRERTPSRSGIPVLDRSISPNYQSPSPTILDAKFQLNSRRSREPTRQMSDESSTNTFCRTAKAATSRRTRIPSPVSRGLTESVTSSFQPRSLQTDYKYNNNYNYNSNYKCLPVADTIIPSEEIQQENNVCTFKTLTAEEICPLNVTTRTSLPNIISNAPPALMSDLLAKSTVKSSLRKAGREKLRKVSVRFMDQETSSRETLPKLIEMANDSVALSVPKDLINDGNAKNYKLFYKNYRKTVSASKTASIDNFYNTPTLNIECSKLEVTEMQTPIVQMESITSLDKSQLPNLAPTHTTSSWGKDLQADTFVSECALPIVAPDLALSFQQLQIEETSSDCNNHSNSSSNIGIDEHSNLSSLPDSAATSVCDNRFESPSLNFSHSFSDQFVENEAISLVDGCAISDSSKPANTFSEPTLNNYDSIFYSKCLNDTSLEINEVESKKNVPCHGDENVRVQIDVSAIYTKPIKNKFISYVSDGKLGPSSTKKRNSKHEDLGGLSGFVSPELLHKHSREELDSSDVTLRTWKDNQDKPTPCRLSQLFLTNHLEKFEKIEGIGRTTNCFVSSLPSSVCSSDLPHYTNSTLSSNIINRSQLPECGTSSKENVSKAITSVREDWKLNCSNSPERRPYDKTPLESSQYQIRKYGTPTSLLPLDKGPSSIQFGLRTSLNNLVEEYCGDISIDDFALEPSLISFDDNASNDNDHHLTLHSTNVYDSPSYSVYGGDKSNSYAGSSTGFWERRALSERHDPNAGTRTRGAYCPTETYPSETINSCKQSPILNRDFNNAVDCGEVNLYRGEKLPIVSDSLLLLDSDSSSYSSKEQEDSTVYTADQRYIEDRNTRLKQEFERILLDYDMPKPIKVKKSVKFDLER